MHIFNSRTIFSYPSEEPRFFRCLFNPAETLCFGGVTLKCGVITIAIIDMLVSLFYLSAFIDLMQHINEYGYGSYNRNIPSQGWLILDFIIGMLAFIPAALGFYGAASNKSQQLTIYSNYKHFECVLLLFWGFIWEVILTHHKQSLFFYILSHIIRCSFNTYWTFIVWSANIKMVRGESISIIAPDIVEGIAMKPVEKIVELEMSSTAQQGKIISTPQIITNQK